MLRTIAVLLLFSLVLEPIGFAQDQSSNAPTWSVLNSMPVGQKLQVDAKEGKSIRGTLDGIGDNALEMTVDGKAVSLKSEQIRRIYILRGRSVTKRALIGMAAGAGGGAAVGGIAARKDNWIISQGAVIAAFAGAGAVIGALTGLALGMRQKKDLVYEAAPVR
jgi:hypothetical protein